MQRDRYRAVLLAASERLEGDQIAGRIGRSPRFVDEWVGRYRRNGLKALEPRRQPGRPPKLTIEQEQRLKARLDAGPTAADGGVCTLRGRDVVRILQQEFGVEHTLGSIYGVLDRIGYSCLKPRPRHEKNDPQAMQRFKQDAPFLSAP
jgi:transposase